MDTTAAPSPTPPPVIARMQAVIATWQARGDQRAVFLACYCQMTANMLAALDRHEFHDPVWVDRLLHHFADYYFVALDAYEREPTAAPQVWQVAHGATRDPHANPLQRLLLGVSAHINYDLALTVADLLAPEWADLTPEQRARRYADYAHVNSIIGATIDAVQDDILTPAMPVMGLVDRLLGPLDELLISRLLVGWRAAVWQAAVALVEAPDPVARARQVLAVEDDALQIARRLTLG